MMPTHNIGETKQRKTKQSNIKNSVMKPNSISDTESSDASCHASDDEMLARVKFEKVKIRTYDVTLGDNPSCSYGPPIGLDWEFDEASSICIEEYEEKRGRRRQMHQMQIPAFHRKRILENGGTTPDEMEYRVNEMNRIKQGRERTKMMLPFLKLQEAAETAKRQAGGGSCYK